MRSVVFDIETLPVSDPGLERAVRREAEEKAPAASASKAKKEAWYTEEATRARGEEAWLKTAVDVLLAEVCVISIQEEGGAVQTWQMGLDEWAEPEVLEAAADYLNTLLDEDTVLAGHNIKGFDLAILLNRWRRYEIEPPRFFPVYGRGRWYGGCRLYDTMERVCAKTPFVSLEDACAAYGLGKAKSLEWDGAPMDGSRVFAAFEAGKFELLAQYCEADVAAERALFERMTFGGRHGLGDGDAREAMSAAIGEIEAQEELTWSQRELAIMSVLRANGLVPKGVRPCSL